MRSLPWINYGKNGLSENSIRQNKKSFISIPLQERKGCGYVFSDNHITPDEAKIEIENEIGREVEIQKDIKFKQLGLVIIDEEHRFGVRQKDQFKALRAEVDILTLTATPIPRTLNMAFSGMRDLSIIATPPAKRMAIKTFVQQEGSPCTTIQMRTMMCVVLFVGNHKMK